MDSMNIKLQIKKIENQRNLNEQFQNQQEEIYITEIRNINNKIIKTNSKIVKWILLDLKKKIKDDYIYSNSISYSCEITIRNRLKRLYDQLNGLNDDH